MLKQKALRKIFITTLTMFIILSIYTIPNTYKKDNILRTNLEIEEITGFKTDKIYLLNKDNYLVKTDIFIDSNNTKDKIEKIINYLIIDNSKIPVGLYGYIPKKTKLLNYNIESNSLLLNFSKEFLNTDDEETIITGIVYSLIELEDINEVSFQIEGKFYKDYNNLNKNIGINKNILYTNTRDINKVVVYYLDNTDSYYIPVTKYLNDRRDKIEIIIDELKNTKKGLISYLSDNTELLNYKEENNLFILNFNDELKENDPKSKEKTLNTIAYSVFDNYDVNMVMFEINGENYEYIKR
ncbi:MAG: GerMN domain-containing protein [Bacilli bacterium]|nr:GerMN domain-containing protein [Bacilli bacterium]